MDCSGILISERRDWRVSSSCKFVCLCGQFCVYVCFVRWYYEFLILFSGFVRLRCCGGVCVEGCLFFGISCSDDFCLLLGWLVEVLWRSVCMVI